MLPIEKARKLLDCLTAEEKAHLLFLANPSEPQYSWQAKSYKKRLSDWLNSNDPEGIKWFEHYSRFQPHHQVRPGAGTYYFLSCGLGIFCDTLSQSHEVSLSQLKR